jgi:excisionase family DNA binding protein
MKSLSTSQAAKMLGVGIRTLSRYVAEGKVPAPKIIQVGGNTVHVWTENEIEKVRELLPKIANGRKTRYSKTRKTSK